MKITKKKVIAILMAVIVVICLSISVSNYMSDYSIRKDVWNQLTVKYKTVPDYDWENAKMTRKNGEILIEYDNGLVGLRAHVNPITHRISRIDLGD